MRKSEQLMIASRGPGHQSDNLLARRQQELIAEVLPQFSDGMITTGITSVSIAGDHIHEINKRNMKARLKEKLKIKS